MSELARYGLDLSCYSGVVHGRGKDLYADGIGARRGVGQMLAVAAERTRPITVGDQPLNWNYLSAKQP